MTDREAAGAGGPAPQELLDTADFVVGTLRGAMDSTWDVPAGDLTWSCRTTADHVADGLLWYAAHLSRRARRRMPHLRRGDPGIGPPELLEVILAAAWLLADVARCAPPGTRAFHPAGDADPSGFVAMACDELLVHTYDIALGLGIACSPPAHLARQVVQRLFPWAPDGHEPWPTLLWANGRTALPGHPRVDDDWFWHCAPLAEWDGRIKRRSTARF